MESRNKTKRKNGEVKIPTKRGKHLSYESYLNKIVLPLYRNGIVLFRARLFVHALNVRFFVCFHSLKNQPRRHSTGRSNSSNRREWQARERDREKTFFSLAVTL